MVTEEGRRYCRYDSDIATGLGVGSFFLLVVSQVTVMIVTRCLCCGKPMRPSGSRSWAICLFITSWYVLNRDKFSSFWFSLLDIMEPRMTMPTSVSIPTSSENLLLIINLIVKSQIFATLIIYDSG